MTGPDPARLHQSSRQLEGDGGRVDVEQLTEPVKAATDLVVEWGSGDLSPGRMRNMIAELLVQRDAAYTATIRRQDAALTAVRELARQLGEESRIQHADRYSEGISVGKFAASHRIHMALASPDTTQEAGA